LTLTIVQSSLASQNWVWTTLLWF